MLHIHRAERADGLAAALAELLKRPLPDPMAAELVAVPTRGMERWLSQQLSSHLGASPGRADGVCAGVEFPSPRRLIAGALAAASGVNPDEDPWAPERSVWPLLDVVDEHIEEPWLGSLAAYLGHGGEPDPVRRNRRLATVRHFAHLFDAYARHRPEMVCAWAADEDDDGDGVPLAPANRWQAALWRALHQRIGRDDPAQRLAPACARLRDDGDIVDLPARLSVFGLTRLPASELHVLRALASRREVHLFLLHPSPALWRACGAALEGRPRKPPGPLGAARAPRRGDDPTAEVPRHPLLASWGRDAREMQLVLAEGAAHGDHHEPMPRRPRSLLEHLQAAIADDRAPDGPRARLDPSDRSVQVHACHGRARQVEVLRDAVLHLLADDPTLEPRDVIVMCPDIETFAPLIHATFGAGEPARDDGDGAHPDLRVRLADRSLRQTNPVLAAVAELLDLAGQRLTASQLLGFADREPVRRRLGLRDEDLARLQDWVAEAGIRWGLDAEHRAPYRLEELPQGTWRRGLDRLLVGVAMTEAGSRLFSGVLPVDDVESGAIELAGRAAELVARVGQAVDAFSVAQSIEAWARAIATAADSLTATPGHEAWQRAELQRILDELVAEAAGEVRTAITPTEIRALLADRLAGHPTRANFRTGHLTVCTLYPMRSVPHRVVCLLGLDDGAFPRKTPRDGDDLMLADPLAGERDPRSEDRQLLLDALMAATERVAIFYTGNDERNNLPRPPAVPVGELLDVIDATADAGADRARDQVLVRHPLQPFDARNFAPGELVTGRPWSFDETMLAGAVAQGGPRAGPRAFLPARLPALEDDVIELEDLVRFVQFPVRAFLRRRLRVFVGADEDEVLDALPVELDALDRWGVGQRLLDAVLDGIDPQTAYRAEIARGTLPPNALALPVVEEILPIVTRIADGARGQAPDATAADPLDVHVELPDGRRLTGTVEGVRGDVLLSATYSRVAAKHRLTAWARLLAASASMPERPLRAVTAGRGHGRLIAVVDVGPLGADAAARRDAAMAELVGLVDLYDRGMREPLPLFCQTSAAYAQALRAGEPAFAAATQKWESGFDRDGEDREAEHQLVLGGVRTLEELLDQPPADDERGPSWPETELTRLGRLACRLWDGLLDRERMRMS